jgi:hypothetical protein
LTEGLSFGGRVAQTGGKLKGPLLVKGSFEWSGGEELEGTTEVEGAGKLVLKSGSESLAERVLKVVGGAKATMAAGSDLVVGEESRVENAGSFEVVDGAEDGTRVSGSGFDSAFLNLGSGTFSRSGSGGALPVELPFDNDGMVDVSGGALQLEQGGVEGSSAVFSSSAEGAVSFAQGTFTLTEGLSFGGRVAQTGGKLKGPLLVKGSFEWSGGEELEGTTEVVSGGSLSIGPGEAGLQARTLKVDLGASVTMAAGAALIIGEGASVRNAGSFEVQGGEEGATRIAGDAASVFRNVGTFTRTGPGGALPIGVAFDNEGTVDVSGGALQLDGGGTEASSAVFSSSAEGAVSFAQGTFTLTEGLSFGGRVAQTGGKLKGPLQVRGSFEWSGGEELEGTTEVMPGARLSLGAASESLEAGRALQVDAGAAAVMAAGSDLGIGENAAVRNAGSFEVEGGEEDGTRISYGGIGSLFRNTGTFARAGGGGGALPVDVAFDNEGAVDVIGGVLSMDSYTQLAHGLLSVHLAGSLSGTGFGQLDIDGTATLEGGLRVTTEDGFHPEPGQRFQILSATSLVGSFDAMEEVGSIGGGWSYTTVYGPSGIELVVAGGPVPTATTATLAGGGQTGTAISVPEGTVVTAGASLSGANASTATGSVSYRVYSDASCSDEVANAGTVAIGSGGTVAASSQEVFTAGTYYWQAAYSGDSTNQRSSTPCGSEVETVQAPPAKVAKSGVLSSLEELPPPVSGRTANLAPVSGVVQVKLPGSRSFKSLTTARSVPEGTLVDSDRGFVALCRASGESAKQCAEFNGGEFRIEEKKNAPTTELALEGGDFAGCPASRKGTAAAASAQRAGKPERRLWGSGHGHFTTDGRNSATTVRGTIWSVEDRCSSTVTKVMRGVVSVYDYRLHRSFQVSAGHSYVARAR